MKKRCIKPTFARRNWPIIINTDATAKSSKKSLTDMDVSSVSPRYDN